MNKPMEVIVISYIPLLTGEAGSNMSPNIIKDLDEYPSGQAEGCVWLTNENGPFPCLIFDNAAKIADHLRFWAENKPEEWFNLAYAEYNGLYGIALLPDFERGIERFRIAYQLRNGFPLPENAKYNILFRPLHFTSKPNHCFGSVKPSLKDKVDFYIIDPKDMKNQAWDKAILIGKFEFTSSGPLCKYILNQLESVNS